MIATGATHDSDLRQAGQDRPSENLVGLIASSWVLAVGESCRFGLLGWSRDENLLPRTSR